MNPAEEIRNRIVNGFAINQIPEKKKKWFIEFAQQEFCDNRGMALAHLIDFYTGLLGSGTEHLEIAINSLAQEVEELKKRIDEIKKQEEQPKIKTMMNGKKR